MSKIHRYLFKINMSDKEEHHSDSDSDMAECLNGLSSESSGSQSANILIFKYWQK